MSMNIEHHIVGRQKELSELKQVFDVVRQGKHRVVLIAGEAGIGKTMLAEECLEGGGFRVFSARSQEDASPPYAPIAAVLRNCLRAQPQVLENCGSLTPYLSLLLPEIGLTPQEVSRELLAEAISAMLLQIATAQPLAIFLDDLHWADNATLELLPLLTDRFHQHPLLILATYRNDELPRGHRLRWLRNELRRRRRLHEITLDSLTREETALLAEHIFEHPAAPQLVDLIYDRTLGLPLFVEELSRVLLSSNSVIKRETGFEMSAGKDIPIPESIRDAVLLQLDDLSDSARGQVEVAAIAGNEFDLELLEKLSQQNSGLDELLARNIIIEVSNGKGAFRHAITREAIRSEMMWSRRRSLHREIAAYLEAANASPEVTAEHWLAANETEKARKALLDSAERSCQLYAYLDAAQAANRALQIWPDNEEEELRLATLERLAHCAQISGKLSDAVRALKEMLESPMVRDDLRRYAEVQRSLATVYGLQGSWEQSLNARKASAVAFEKAGLFGAAANEFLAAAGRNTGMYQLEEALQLCDKAIALAEKSERRDIQARTMGLKGNVLAMLGEFEQGIGTVNRGLSLALESNLNDVAAEVYRRLGGTLEYAADYTHSKEAYLSAYNFCRNQGEAIQAQVCLGCMSYVLFRTGDWKQCLEISRELLNDPDSPLGSRSIAIGAIGFISCYRGEIRQARKNLRETLHIALRDKIQAMEVISYWGLALVEEFDAQPDAAEKYYRQLLTAQQKYNDAHDSLPGLMSAITFFSDRKLDKEVNLCANILADIAAKAGNTEAIGMLAYALGETSLLNDQPKEAAHQFLQSVAHLEKLEIPIEIIKAEFRAGVALARMNSVEEAVKHLRNAYRTARKLGARALAAKIAEELEGLGETAEERRSPEAEQRIQRGGLTSRQVEIARLISEGLTNKEIADKLFLSPRTVEMHVANILSRLDCRSRSEAVRKAVEMGILD